MDAYFVLFSVGCISFGTRAIFRRIFKKRTDICAIFRRMPRIRAHFSKNDKKNVEILQLLVPFLCKNVIKHEKNDE